MDWFTCYLPACLIYISLDNISIYGDMPSLFYTLCWLFQLSTLNLSVQLIPRT